MVNIVLATAMESMLKEKCWVMARVGLVFSVKIKKLENHSV